MYDYNEKFDEWTERFEDAVKSVREYYDPKTLICDLMDDNDDKILYLAAYAYDAAREAGYGYTERDLEAHIDTLIDYGLKIDADEYEAAVSLAQRWSTINNDE